MKFAANNRDERTPFSIYKMFSDSKHNYDEEVLIFIPFDILMETVCSYCYDNYDVKIDGKDTSVWNLFAGTNFIEGLFDDEDFINVVTKAYENSAYIESDYFDWVDSEPWEEEEDYYE